MSDTYAGTTDWLELSLSIKRDMAEIAADILRRFCYGGVALEEPLASSEEGYSIIPNQPITVKGYLPVGKSLGLRRFHLRKSLEKAGIVGPWEEKRLREEDWAQAWKVYFNAQRIGRRLVVVPSWEEWQEGSDDIVIRLDPGMAFGTGDHPTTRMCLEELEKSVKPGDRIIDLGTGSGILAIAAAKLGAGRVLALDVDPIAVRVAHENVSANGLSDKIIVEVGSLGLEIEKAFGPGDILVANLSSQPIMELAEVILRAIKPEGLFIGGGISAPYLKDVKEALRTAGARMFRTRKAGEWRSIVARLAFPT